RLLFRTPWHGEKLAAARAGPAAEFPLTRAADSGPGLGFRFPAFVLGLTDPLPAEADLAVARIEPQDLHLDLVAALDHILGALDPVVGQLGDVHQALQAGLQLDEDAEVGQLGDLALLDLAGAVATGDVALPGVAGHLLEAQSHPLAVLVHDE